MASSSEVEDDDGIIVLEKFLNDWVELIPETYFIQKFHKIEDAVLAKSMKQFPDVVAELATVCDPSTLLTTDQPVSQLKALCNLPTDTNLVTLKSLAKKKESKALDTFIHDYDEIFYDPNKAEEKRRLKLAAKNIDTSTNKEQTTIKKAKKNGLSKSSNKDKKDDGSEPTSSSSDITERTKPQESENQPMDTSDGPQSDQVDDAEMKDAKNVTSQDESKTKNVTSQDEGKTKDMTSEDETKEDDLETHPVDLILTVHVYDTYHLHKQLKYGTPPLNQEFRVLGSQCLTELRDYILCSSDFKIAGEHSNNPELIQNVCAKDLYKSGFFMIENVIYNDMRFPDNRDYSQCIINWSNRENIEAGPFTSKLMNETLFIDLSIKLGQPYLYMHQGNCEHVFIFTSVRVMHELDGPINRYPLLTGKRRRNRVLCRGCHLNSAKWTVTGSQFAVDDPSYFCDECFTMLHYDVDGNKVGNFKAYAYVSNALF